MLTYRVEVPVIDGVDGRVPDLEIGSRYLVVRDLGDRMIVDVVTPPGERNAVLTASRIVVNEKLADVNTAEISDEDAAALADLFPVLRADISVTAGEVYRWDGTLVQARQAATVESWWLDLDTLPESIFRVYRTAPPDPDLPPPDWDPAIAGQGGYPEFWDGTTNPVIVSHAGKTWLNTHGDNNVWEPGAVGVHDSIWAEVIE